jgi:hypothetical protein
MYQTLPCTLVLRLEQNEDLSDSQEWGCELADADAVATGIFIASVQGLSDTELTNAESGKTTLISPGAMIVGDTLTVPSDSAVQFGEVLADANLEGASGDSRRSFGTKSVLVIRVNAADVSTTSSISQLEDDVFDDSVNLMSQYAACSHQQLVFEPFQGVTETGVTVERGVVEITIADTVQGNRMKVIENSSLAEARKVYGALTQFDFVMICQPPGIIGGWYVRFYFTPV